MHRILGMCRVGGFTICSRMGLYTLPGYIFSFCAMRPRSHTLFASPCMTVHVVTYASDPWRARYLLLLQTYIVNLCTGTWTGDFRDKIRAVAAFAASKPPDDLVCFVDAYDVIVAREDGPARLLEACASLETDEVLVSAETNCFPWAHVRDLYPYSMTPYRFLNSGGYVGRATAVSRLFQSRLVSDNALAEAPCDQGFLTYLYLRGDSTIRLDTACDVFQSMYGVPWSHFQVGNGSVVNTHMHTEPIFLHFNGTQYLMEDDASILPVVLDLVRSPVRVPLGAFPQQQPVPPWPAPLPTDTAIIQLARRRAHAFRPPDQTRIHQRDWDNQHAIFCGHTCTTKKPADFQEQFSVESRAVVSTFLKRVGSSSPLQLDILLHDYLGRQHNTQEWPHSILGFSTQADDDHNVCVPDRYAMQNYRGMDFRDGLPTVCKRNRLLFIGSSTGKLAPHDNLRVQVCTFAASRHWIDAYISEAVNGMPGLDRWMHEPMTLDDQRQIRHILVVDGNTACWDRLPWVLASKCVCWKLESDHVCWYYPFLQPWVHYVPCTLDTLEETWLRVKDDEEAQRRMVRAANAFARAYLRPDAHVLYTRVLLDEIQKNHESQTHQTHRAGA